MTSTISYNGVEYVQFNPDIEPVDDYTIKLGENGGTVKYFKKKETFPKLFYSQSKRFSVKENGEIVIQGKLSSASSALWLDQSDQEKLSQVLALSDKLRGKKQ